MTHHVPVPRAHPSPDGPAPLKEFRVQVTYDALVEDAVYQLIVPFGESLRLAAQVDATDAYQCDRIAVSQGDDPWFEIGRIDNISTMSKNGIACDVSFGAQEIAVTIANSNRSGKTIVMRVVPRFTDGKRTRNARDPQIVLPPEKDDGFGGGGPAGEDVQASG
jgi:hypothetical protein